MPVYRLPEAILFPPVEHADQERSSRRRRRSLAGTSACRLPGGDLPLVRRRRTDPLVVAGPPFRPLPGRTPHLPEHEAIPEKGARPDHVRPGLPGGDRRLPEAPPRTGRHLDHAGNAGGLLPSSTTSDSPTPSRSGREEELVGGLYGVSLGRAFFGESMFSAVPNASKAALITLVPHLKERGFDLIDCQVETAHLAGLGARPIPRRDFCALLQQSLRHETLRGNWGEWLPETGARLHGS